MKFGEDSPEQDPLARLVEERFKAYQDKENAAKKAKIEETLSAFQKKLGLKPGQTFKDFFGLTPSTGVADKPASAELDPSVGQAIDDLFEGVRRVYLEGADWEDTFGTAGSSKPNGK